ncbi:GNAT family N-acetyltransferase [Candidatus Woesearchaeota archaeon]|nr:GNAT family N-acetyltransferase [Candidatus Woesearchaeota archaeon]
MGGKLIIREIRADDALRVKRLIDEVFNRHDKTNAKDDIRFHFKCQEFRISNGDLYWLAEINDRIVGITGLTQTTKGVFWLAWLGVKKRMQGQGIGKQLLKYAIREAKKRNAKKFCIRCGSLPMFSKANSLYKKCGFEEQFRIRDYWARGDDLIVVSQAIDKILI